MILPVSEAQFFSEFWQQKPLLCPQAFADFSSPITPEELAGLAMETDAESRLVWQRGGVWQQQLGPFNENDFQRKAHGRFWCSAWITGFMRYRHCERTCPKSHNGDSMM